MSEDGHFRPYSQVVVGVEIAVAIAIGVVQVRGVGKVEVVQRGVGVVQGAVGIVQERAVEIVQRPVGITVEITSVGVGIVEAIVPIIVGKSKGGKVQVAQGSQVNQAART